MSRIFPPIEIRSPETIDELKAIEELQLEVWGCSEREVLSSLTLIPLLDIGGVLIGAFAEGKLIGFVVGFPGLESGEPILHSDMLAVKSEYRSTGLGYKLKLAQREAALANGIKRITWTFDPLQSANAHFNFGKLGVVADSYKINYYGETSSLLHRTGTDRLWVTWWLQSERVNQRLAGGTILPPALSHSSVLLKLDSAGEPVAEAPDLKQSVITIEIPHSVNSIVAMDPSRANRWREATRRAFTMALAANFMVADFVRGARDDEAGTYVLTRSN